MGVLTFLVLFALPFMAVAGRDLYGRIVPDSTSIEPIASADETDLSIPAKYRPLRKLDSTKTF